MCEIYLVKYLCGCEKERRFKQCEKLKVTNTRCHKPTKMDNPYKQNNYCRTHLVSVKGGVEEENEMLRKDEISKRAEAEMKAMRLKKVDDEVSKRVKAELEKMRLKKVDDEDEASEEEDETDDEEDTSEDEDEPNEEDGPQENEPSGYQAQNKHT